MQHKKKYKVSSEYRVYGNYPAKSPEEALEKMKEHQKAYHYKELMEVKEFHVKRGMKEWDL